MLFIKAPRHGPYPINKLNLIHPFTDIIHYD